MKVQPCLSARPTKDEVETALRSVAATLALIVFRYDPLPECRTAMTPSKAAAAADTIQLGELDEVKGFAVENSVFTTKSTDRKGNPIEVHLLLRLRTMNRRKANERGIGYNPGDKGSYLWRSYRWEGIRLDTVKVCSGGRWQRLFPAVQIETDEIQTDNPYMVDLAAAQPRHAAYIEEQGRLVPLSGYAIGCNHDAGD